MQKQGFRPATVLGSVRNLKILFRRSSPDPETVKRTIAGVPTWKDGFKRNLVDAYAHWAKWKGFVFEKPKYTPYEELPFIPLETELDSLISGTGPKTGTVLQLLKEVGCRPGEAFLLKWTDLEADQNLLRVRPEKNSKPGQYRLSSVLVSRILRLRLGRPNIFTGSVESFRRDYERQRKNLSIKLSNPRLQKVKLTTFRHWKATTEYARTKDLLYVKERVLRHRSLKNVLRYTQLVDWKEDEYSCKIARTSDEARVLVESGFDYVCDVEGLKLFRKRK